MITGLAFAIVMAAGPIGVSSELSYVATWTTELSYPARLAPSPGGGVYVTDPPMKRIVHFDATGAVVGTYTIAQGPVGVAVHADGRVFISREDGVIGVYSATLVSLGTVNAAPFTLSGPNDLAMHPVSNELFTVDSAGHRIMVFAESSPGTWTLSRSWGMEGVGLGQFSSPQAIAIDAAAEHVIVTDTDNFRVQIFDATGILLFKFGYRTLYLPDTDVAWVARAEGVAVDDCGNIYLGDALMGTLRVFSNAGGELNGLHLPAVGYGSAPGQLRVPCDIAIDENGNLYVANTNNGAVEVFLVECTTAGAAAAPGTPRDTSEKRMVFRPRSANNPRWTGSEIIRRRTPDNPADIVPLINAAEYREAFDLNRDGVVNATDLEIAVAEFGAGSVDDFIDLESNAADADHPALAPPHILDLPNRCGRCHSMDGAPGGMLTAAGQENLCQSCHSAGKIAGNAWIGPGSYANSHPWGVPADDLHPQSELAHHLDNGNVRCATCHEPHQSSDVGQCDTAINKCDGGPFQGSVCQDNTQCAPLVNYMREEIYRAGGDHLLAQTSPNPSALKRMTAMDPTLCGECHTDIVEQWNIAGHADLQADPFVHYDWSLSNRASCRRCHSGFGYTDFANGVAETQQRGNLRVVDCLVCHSTHGAPQEDTLLRIYDEVTLPSGQIITDAGPGATCISCHNGRRQPPIPNPPGVVTIHYLSGGVMLEGVNGVTTFDGTTYELSNSNHTTNAGIDCTVCHMAPGPTAGLEVGKVGGHTFRLKDHDTGYENVGNTCATAACHPGATTINLPANGDYDGDSVTEGVQNETQGLLNLLEVALNAAGAYRLLDETGHGVNPYWATKTCTGGTRAGLVCTGTAPFDCPGGSCTNSVPAGELATVEDGIWNWEYVDNSGDLGVKNTGYAIGLLQVAYKGVTNNPVPNAAYRYSPAP